MLTINEIFHSIQGESTHAGRPCVFVRLTACDLRCSWCDTAYAFHEGRKMSIDEVIASVLRERKDRDRIRVATKGGLQRQEGRWTNDGRPKHIRAACERSISRDASSIEA